MSTYIRPAYDIDAARSHDNCKLLLLNQNIFYFVHFIYFFLYDVHPSISAVIQDSVRSRKLRKPCSVWINHYKAYTLLLNLTGLILTIIIEFRPYLNLIYTLQRHLVHTTKSLSADSKLDAINTIYFTVWALYWIVISAIKWWQLVLGFIPKCCSKIPFSYQSSGDYYKRLHHRATVM